MRRQHKYISNFPSGYTELEWLANYGSESPYIVTDINCNTNWTYKCKFEAYSYPNSAFLFGNNVISGAYQRFLCLYLPYSRVDYSFGGSYTNINPTTNSYNNIIEITINKTTIKIEDSNNTETRNISGSTIVSNSLILFAVPSSGYMRSYAKIYGFEITDSSNNLIHQLVPSKRNSDLVVGMLDLITEEFYIKSGGTGDFLYG